MRTGRPWRAMVTGSRKAVSVISPDWSLASVAADSGIIQNLHEVGNSFQVVLLE